MLHSVFSYMLVIYSKGFSIHIMLVITWRMNIPQRTACLAKGYGNNQLTDFPGLLLDCFGFIFPPNILALTCLLIWDAGQHRRTDRQYGILSLSGSQNLCQTINPIPSRFPSRTHTGHGITYFDKCDRHPCASYYHNLSNVCGRICPATLQLFTIARTMLCVHWFSYADRRAPNLAWRSRLFTDGPAPNWTNQSYF